MGTFFCTGCDQYLESEKDGFVCVRLPLIQADFCGACWSENENKTEEVICVA